MKLGFVSAILPDYSFEEVINLAADIGYECVEVCCWPREAAARRYAGVSHIDVANLTQAEADRLSAYCRDKAVEISALAYYPNNLDGNEQNRRNYHEHLKRVILAAEMLGLKNVNTFIGRVTEKNIDENLELFKTVWPPLIQFAEEHGVKIGIENCPMLFDYGQWPGGQNLATTPAVWRRMFELLPSESLGLNYDPSHFIWQFMDPIKPVYEFREKLFHIHFKDIKLYRDKLDSHGSMGVPLDYMAPKLPGLGDVDWGAFVSALTDVGFDGCACVEVEDRAFENSNENREKSLRLSYAYLRQFVI
jgi:sugar phosphate isomerase/epimerase